MKINEKKITEELIQLIRESFNLGTGVIREKFRLETFKKHYDPNINQDDCDILVDHIYFKYIHQEKQIFISVIDKNLHSKGRSAKEKESRRINDFKKNIMPTLPREDRSHFERKFKSKGL